MTFTSSRVSFRLVNSPAVSFAFLAEPHSCLLSSSAFLLWTTWRRRRRREEEEGGGGGRRREEEEGGGGVNFNHHGGGWIPLHPSYIWQQIEKLLRISSESEVCPTCDTQHQLVAAVVFTGESTRTHTHTSQQGGSEQMTLCSHYKKEGMDEKGVCVCERERECSTTSACLKLTGALSRR